MENSANPNKRESLPRERKAIQKRKSSTTSIPRKATEEIGFLPSLDADEQIHYYSAKYADAEIARSEIAECHRILADASEQFDAIRAHKLKCAIAETARFLGWKGGAG